MRKLVDEATVTLDRAGRITLPRDAQRKLGIKSGDSQELEVVDGALLLRPVCKKRGMMKKEGIWVFTGGDRTTADLCRTYW